MTPLSADIPSLDIRSSIDGLRRRWWIVVVTIAVALIVVFVQDTGLRSEPAGETVVTARYQAEIETDELALAAVDPASVNPVPSYENQLAILTSPETLDELQKATGSTATVEVERSEPRFTITDTIDEENNYVSFLRTGNPTYTFICKGENEGTCVDLIDAYVTKTGRLRTESITGGLDDGERLLESLIDSTSARLAALNAGDDRRAATLVELASLHTKLEAVRFVRSNVNGNLVVVSQDSRVSGKTLNSVSASTYGFGFGVGLIVGLLIALQLTAMDRVIRRGWQVTRLGGDVRLLGSPHPRRDAAQAVAIGASLKTAAASGSRSAVIVALGESSQAFAREVMEIVPELSTTVIASADAASVNDIGGDPSRSLVLLVDAGHTTRDQVAEAIGLLTSGGARLLGVALVG